MTRRLRGGRVTGAISQPTFGQVPRLYPPIEVISADQVEAIHRAALRVLAEIGMRVLDAPARGLYAGAGARIGGGGA